MMGHARATTCGLAMILLFHAAPASSTPLVPGATGIVPTALGPASSIGSATFLFDSGVQSFTFGPAGQQVSVHFGEAIIKDPFAPLFACGANCLDFLLEAQLVSGPAGATTRLTSVSMNTFGVSAVDVGWLLDTPSFVVPTTADRGPAGDVVTFNFAPGIPTGPGLDTSQILVIRTDRTTFSAQDFVGFAASVSFTGGPTVTSTGLATVQTAVPEPGSLVLLGTGLVGAGRHWRKRRNSREV